MKKFISSILFLAAALTMNAQDARQRTVETVVADVLAAMPANNATDFNTQMADLAAAAPASVVETAKMMKPAGEGVRNNLYEYALTGLASYASANPQCVDKVREGFILAIKATEDSNNKAFLLNQFRQIAKPADAQFFKEYVSDSALASTAIGALVDIPGTEDLITDSPRAGTPTMLCYKTHADADSMYNTPPCYTIYVLGKVLHWIEKNGGAEGMLKRNKEKADYLYNFLDSSDFYHATAEKGSRSLMNVPFLTKYSAGATDEASLAKEKEINDKFVKEAAAAGLVNLKGHRLVGGMRASIYNAMSLDGVKALVEFMKKFAAEN